MPNTLFGRLFISSTIILSLFFGLIAYITHQLNLENTYNTKQEQLKLQNYVLLSSASIGDDNIELPDELREPRFDEYESGLYGVISSGNKIYWSSYSAHNLHLTPSDLTNTLAQSGEHQFLVSDKYMSYHYAVEWELGNEEKRLFIFSVLEDIKPTITKLNEERTQLHRWLASIAILLIIILLLIMRWGTRPLRILARNLKQIEKGDKEHLEGHYPKELQPITKNLNQLITNERLQRERYHNTLADLAHSLKTPLAVIQSTLEEKSETLANNPIINEQTQRMDEIINHQLQRAVLATSHRLTESVNIENCVKRLTTAMKKVYADKNIHFTVDIKTETVFKGDERDLMEILGNLLDNACKACQNHIHIISQTDNNILCIEIHDDGPGIPEQQRNTLIQRGQRADTKHDGQGIGLNVVTDIIDSYQGKFHIKDSYLGGAAINIEFPL